MGRIVTESRCGVSRANEADVQPFPRSGILKSNMNFSLDVLRERLTSVNGTLYAYVITSIKWDNERFQQTGCAPNFQGDFITLCTCKHEMRTLLDTKSWHGKWVAGFTSINAVGNRQWNLVYLMQVGQAFETHAQLWNALPERTRQAKEANKHRLGDLYQPKAQSSDPYQLASYKLPHEAHVHHSDCNPDGWHNDITYSKPSRLPAALLVGDRHHSFLWDTPLIYAPFPLGIGHRKKTLEDLLRIGAE